jgi:hypothetical protein
MRNTKVEVVKTNLESWRDNEEVELVITVKRISANYYLEGREPDVEDVPQDFRKALEEWLGHKYDTRWKIEALTPYAVPGTFLGEGPGQSSALPVLRLDDVMEIIND